jgi:hypothetical protein
VSEETAPPAAEPAIEPAPLAPAKVSPDAAHLARRAQRTAIVAVVLAAFAILLTLCALYARARQAIP